MTVVPFPPFTPLHPAYPHPPTFSPYSSCPWVIHISSLPSTFPILFLTSPCLFSTYHLCYLLSVPFPPLSPSHSPVDNPPCELHFGASVSVLVVCLVRFCFCEADLGPQDLLLRFQYSNTHTHGLQRSCGGKGTALPLSQEESASDHLGHSLKGGAPRALP